MSRLASIAVSLAVALPFVASSASAAPSITTIKQVAKKKIVADAKAWMKQTGYNQSLDRPKVKVTFEPVRCGTPPVSIRCYGEVCAMQGSPVPPLPGFPNPKRMLPWAHASFDAVGAIKGKKVSVSRLGTWQVSPPCIIPPPR
jgi:hypothetical protein